MAPDTRLTAAATSGSSVCSSGEDPRAAGPAGQQWLEARGAQCQLRRELWRHAVVGLGVRDLHRPGFEQHSDRDRHLVERDLGPPRDHVVDCARRVRRERNHRLTGRVIEPHDRALGIDRLTHGLAQAANPRSGLLPRYS
jgi:hypothetical protein